MNGETIDNNGTFRHKSCNRVDTFGFGFSSLMCSMCFAIPLENDFRKNILREDITFEKMGTRTTWAERRVGHLSNYELGKHNYDLSRKLKMEKFLHSAARARIVQFKVKRPTLRELGRGASSEHNVIKLCTNIINAHRCGAFGGKPTLWDLLSMLCPSW